MVEESGFPLEAPLLKKGGPKDPGGFDGPEYVKALFAAGERATHTGICLLDTQTRFDWVNAVSRKRRERPSINISGRLHANIVGDLATQIEPIYERVLATGSDRPSGWRVM